MYPSPLYFTPLYPSLLLPQCSVVLSVRVLPPPSHGATSNLQPVSGLVPVSCVRLTASVTEDPVAIVEWA